MAQLIRSSNLLIRRAQSVPSALYHKNVSTHETNRATIINQKRQPNCVAWILKFWLNKIFRSWITMRTHAMLDHWTKAIRMLAPAWSVLQLAVMWWNCKSKLTIMAKSLMQNSRHLAVDQPLHPAHWPPNGWREKPSMKQANWRTRTSLRNSACHRSNYTAPVSYYFL